MSITEKKQLNLRHGVLILMKRKGEGRKDPFTSKTVSVFVKAPKQGKMYLQSWEGRVPCKLQKDAEAQPEYDAVRKIMWLLTSAGFFWWCVYRLS